MLGHLGGFDALGFYRVGFVLSGLYAAAHALERTYREIRARGSTDALRREMMDFSEFAGVVGLEQRYADDARFKA
jgi:2-methylisocitrate lyase-like PEP mutase family enzyme